MANSEFDTIAAISTPVGEGGISIIRISGEEAVAVAKKLYHGSKDLAKVATNTINYGHIVDPDSGAEVDEVMVSIMRAPHTYTERSTLVETQLPVAAAGYQSILQLTS